MFSVKLIGLRDRNDLRPVVVQYALSKPSTNNEHDFCVLLALVQLENQVQGAW